VSKADRKKERIMLNLKAVLIDINGTVLIGSKLIPHSLSAIAK